MAHPGRVGVSPSLGLPLSSVRWPRHLTTGKSGALQGKTFTGSRNTGFTGIVVANDFAVPAIQCTQDCPWLIARAANFLVGLPAASGNASIRMEGSITTP